MEEKTNWMDKITKLDRRWIFIMVAVAVIVPIILGKTFPVNISPSVQSSYDYINNLPPNSTVMIVCDYDPASEAELYPMTLALFRHCFDKGLRVFSFTLWPNGAALIEKAFNTMKMEYATNPMYPNGLQSGVNYVNLGYGVGGALVIIAAGQDMGTAFSMDYRGNSTGSMPIMEGVSTLSDINYVIDLAAGSTIDWWVAYGVQRYHFVLGAGVTAVSATQYYPYLQTGQINGLIGGLKGAAEYEQLAGHPDRALAGMTAQSSVHALIIVLVVISNIFYFLTRKKGR
ncbi:MAG: hypothetical protein NTY09_03125 [bacterium]|nr:hypothetical protein [bacterium]